MTRIEEFTENEEARRLHQQGLELSAVLGNHEDAHDAFGQALGTLDSDFGSDGQDELSRKLQLARVIRDDGFVYVRQGVASPNRKLIIRAFEALRYSEGITSELFDESEDEDIYSERALRLLNSERGITITCLGRAATAGYVLGFEPIEPSPPVIYFDQARRVLAAGSNRYYETVNAVRGALFESVSGAQFARTWMKVAERSVEKASREDPDNYQAADRYRLKYMPIVNNPISARAAILKRP